MVPRATNMWGGKNRHVIVLVRRTAFSRTRHRRPVVRPETTHSASLEAARKLRQTVPPLLLERRQTSVRQTFVGTGGILSSSGKLTLPRIASPPLPDLLSGAVYLVVVKND